MTCNTLDELLEIIKQLRAEAGVEARRQAEPRAAMSIATSCWQEFSLWKADIDSAFRRLLSLPPDDISSVMIASAMPGESQFAPNIMNMRT